MPDLTCVINVYPEKIQVVLSNKTKLFYTYHTPIDLWQVLTEIGMGLSRVYKIQEHEVVIWNRTLT